MRVTLNGVPRELPEHATLAQAVAITGAKPPFAAAVNLQFVPRSCYKSVQLRDDDRIEIVSPVTGG